MNAPAVAEQVTLRLGEAVITVPGELAARAYLERVLERSGTIEISWTAARPGIPAIGTDLGGGKFAGVTVHDNVPQLLVLLEGDNESCTWKGAKEWAESQGGYLPSRFDQLVLFKNLKSEFAEDWYWSGEQRAGDEVFAWCQGFTGGGQLWGHVSGSYRARAVRRLVIQ